MSTLITRVPGKLGSGIPNVYEFEKISKIDKILVTFWLVHFAEKISRNTVPVDLL